jgi:Domain of unknown function (DUF929)
MGRASTVRSLPDRRQKIAAQRAAAQRRQTRNRLLVACGAVGVVVLTAIALVVAKANTTLTSPSGLVAAPVGPTGQALSALVASTTSIPAATIEGVGAGSGADKPVSITGARLTLGPKPEVLYMGAEYCPYCAAERWALIVALSRFGTFSGLATTHSASRNGAGTAEPYAYTRSWTFAHAKYESKYLAFVAVELNNNVPDKATKSYGTLQTPTRFEQSVMGKYDAPPYVASSDSGTIPFTDFGNRYMIVGASYNPAILSGLSWTQIASDLRSPSSPVARAVLGTANYMTAALCQMSNDHPASACTPLVRQLQRKI